MVSVQRRGRRAKGTLASRFLDRWNRAAEQDRAAKPTPPKRVEAIVSAPSSAAPKVGPDSPPEDRAHVRALLAGFLAEPPVEHERSPADRKVLELLELVADRGEASSSAEEKTSRGPEPAPLDSSPRGSRDRSSKRARALSPTELANVESSIPIEGKDKPARTRRERRGGRATQRRESRSRAAFDARCERDAPGCRPRPFTSVEYGTIESVMRDDSGEELRRRLELARSQGWPGVDRCYQACYGFAEDRRRPLSAFRARAIGATWLVILGASLWRAGKTRRHGFWRKTEGFTCRQLRKLFIMPGSGKMPSRGAFDAQSWGAERKAPDDCGYTEALERAGCFRVEQPLVPPDDDDDEAIANMPHGYYADRRYVGRVRFTDKTGTPRRCAFGVFWIYGYAGPPE